MLRRFSLYGFLKNQRYFEPFLVLYFLDLGFGFFEIGLLVAVRELARNLLEVPSGALADVWGRRRTLVLCFSSYLVALAIFGLADRLPLLLGAMMFYGAGDAFRSGTHKALILTWLEREGRLADKTEVYGHTRSWSKLGSAASVVVSTALVLTWGSYRLLFWAALVPQAVDLLNVATYPAELEGPVKGTISWSGIWHHFWRTLRTAWHRPALRRLLAESMGFEGYSKLAREYLQPSLKFLAASAGGILATRLGPGRALAITVGAAYLLLHVFEAAASRRAGRLARFAGGEERAAGVLWRILAGLSGFLVLASLVHRPALFALLLVALLVAQNLWRPILVSRFYRVADRREAATILSLESQAKSLAAMVAAPLLGATVDWTRAQWPTVALLPVAVLGCAVALPFLLGRRSAEGLRPGRAVPK